MLWISMFMTGLSCLSLQLLPCVQNENPYVRDMALVCLGLACLLDISMARKLLLLFLQVG